MKFKIYEEDKVVMLMGMGGWLPRVQTMWLCKSGSDMKANMEIRALPNIHNLESSSLV